MPKWPEWLNYDVLKRALNDLGGPWADELGLAIVVICVVGLGIKLVINPIRRR